MNNQFDKQSDASHPPDPIWSRESPERFWDPGKKLLRTIRYYQRWRARAGWLAILLCRLAVLRHRFWTVVTGADIPLNCHLGGGLVLLHPNGVVIHPEARIGVNCSIFHQVTLGTRGAAGAPTVEWGVEIGAGAKILGAVRIGSNAVIGSNSVVISDVPAGSVAVGVPARVLAAPLGVL